jgi:hypothetical protein
MQQPKKPQNVYKVDWIGQDPNFMFSQTFVDGKQTLDMAKMNPDSVAYKMVKTNKDVIQWQIIPTEGSKEMIRGVKMKRKIREKQGLSNYINADGVGENKIVSTTEYAQNQKSRLITTVVISGALIYAGTRKELQPWLRYTLLGLGGLNAFFNLKNYQINKTV